LPQALYERADMYRFIRQFFAERQVLEVETPIVSCYPVCDPNIEPMQTVDGRYLHTSPEYPMKRLLCAGSGDIYQICKVFRRGELGLRHNPEFSLLEWYRCGFDLPMLMDEVATLVTSLLGQTSLEVSRFSYQQVMMQHVGIDPFVVSDTELCELGQQIAGADLHLGRDGWLDVLMSHLVEPALPAQQLVFVRDFPSSQAALARLRVNAEGVEVAERFELFYRGTELANGYYELSDVNEQRLRFVRDGGERAADDNLLAALQQGLPECSGVALGLDRVLMHRLPASCLAEVISFDWPRA
jgi:elongation factor P--(R)-beta-lysine ligase